VIRLITLEDLHPAILENRIYPDLDATYYWSPTWDPKLYVALARAGFISVSVVHHEAGPVLIAELQARYAVLAWPNLHLSRKLRKLLRSQRIAAEDIELRVVDDPSRVIERLVEQYRSKTWLKKSYVEMLGRLPTGRDPRFSLHGVELWSKRREFLIAGELGYSIGRTYTSLSGFHTRDGESSAFGDGSDMGGSGIDIEPSDGRPWRGFGMLQMWLLGERLRDRGYAFWNLGHTEQAYKQALGARILGRGQFLRRWLGAVDEVVGQESD
jgi:hypothetical protein